MTDSNNAADPQALISEALVHRKASFADPEAVEQLGAQLAGVIPEADALLHWLDDDEAVLGHVVAREKGQYRHEMVLDQGLFSVSSEIQAASRVIVLQIDPGAMSEEALSTYFSRQGHTLVGVFTVAEMA